MSGLVWYRGVWIESRCSKAVEIGVIQEVVDWVDGEFPIHSLWCDSKAGACYAAVVDRCDADAAAVILNHAFMVCGGGHNGIAIDAEDGSSLRDVDPVWVDDEISDMLSTGSDVR